MTIHEPPQETADRLHNAAWLRAEHAREDQTELYRLIREARSSMSLAQIAKETGLSRARIAQIEKEPVR